MTNKLIDETSPYLLQHVDNPVEWYPWNQESLAVARSNEKPILLSIGYAACHWCHVMAHESFEDPETAQFMNEHFVNIKVDREERPDLDSIYMDAVVALTGQGGWPMTVFLTPEGEPFYAGTYFPPTPRFGMPSFRQVLSSVARAWQEKRSEIIESATNLTSYIGRALDLADSKDTISEEILTLAVKAIESNFEPQKGGFGRAPKFPQAMTLEFLLRQYIRTEERNTLHMVEHTLEEMARGGIYDHLGGGFARYATDNDWLVPHFEKMLYDNALLSRVYLHAWRVKERPHYRQVVLETLDWALREMRDPGGGFFSSLDADSEEEEGKYYVWRADEIRDILGEQADLFLNYYGVTGQGNWEGKNILNISASMEGIADISGMSLADAERYISQARKKLYESRERRIRPGRDEKVLTAWNGLMLAALAEAGRDLNRPDLLDAARQNAVFIRQNLRTDSGRLLRTWKAGSGSRYNGYLEDYAFLADGLLALYQSTYEAQWFSWARELADMILRHFYDDERGGFFDTSDDHEALIHRPKSLQDNAIPSGNSMAVNVLLRISLYTGDSRYWDIAEAAVSAMQKAMTKYPTGFAHWLCAADFILGEPLEVALAGNPIASDVQPMIESVFAEYRPNMVVAVGLGEDDIPLLKGRTQIGGKPAAYLCRRFVCDAPITDSQILLDTLA